MKRGKFGAIIIKKKRGIKNMKKLINLVAIILIILSTFTLASCELLSGLFGGGNDDVFTKEYEPITGKFYLYEAYDERVNEENTYFDIDGSKGNFSLNYYENGVLKKQGEFKKIVAKEEKIGYRSDNLHFNLKCGDSYEHIGAYTESFEPLNQFRILEEYSGGEEEIKYYYSELPFVLGVYVREGEEYTQESTNLNQKDYTIPTLANYTSQLDGKYYLDNDHYFYFISPGGYTIANGDYLDSYFQYFSPELDKPIEGFAHGITYENSIAPPRIHFTYSRESSYYDSLEDTEKALMFGYSIFDEDYNMIDYYGSIDFSDGKLNSFSFIHLSRSWTEEEWNEFTSNKDYKMPDSIIYEYVGGTYYKA